MREVRSGTPSWLSYAISGIIERSSRLSRNVIRFLASYELKSCSVISPGVMNSSSVVQRLAGISGALAVAAGAYGAHGFRRSEASDYQRELFDTANKYHIYHSLALLGAARCRKPALAGALLFVGMGCFCGPLYHQALTNDPSFSKLAPIGGSLLIVGWAAMAL
ncbi:hypothetical protein DNTS_000096 [Danionella cerebrum]|uniref:Transmembrane protein 256 n=1 Tax=Danionella cerebrum TaxID=2873325 RepID=A0A553RD82_9TELE|nr:hypothetical protein DNTS_000096 [Danionella translucida]